MSWKIEYLKEAAKDLKEIDNSTRIIILKSIEKVSINPLPRSQGGYGKALGNNDYAKLSGLCKIVLKKQGVRIVYKAVQKKNSMVIVVISARSEFKVYDIAAKRI